MRLLVVTPYYAPDLGPSAPLLTMLCEDLVALGHRVTVLAAVPHFPSGHVEPEYRRPFWKWEAPAGVDVCRLWVPSGDRANLRHRLVTFVVYQLLALIVGLGQRYDAAIITNPAIETGLPFAALAWLRRRPAVFCVWDLYPEVGIRLGVFRNPLVISVVRALEDFCLRRADAVQVLAEGFLENLCGRVGQATRMAVIAPWLDTDFVRPLPRRNAFAEEHGLTDGCVILYAGNLGLSQALDKVLLAAGLLLPQADVRFVFVGEGAAREQLMAQATRLGLSNVRFIPFQPRERLPDLLATADVALVSLQAGIGDDSLPSKTFPLLASGRPIIACVDEGSAIRAVIQQAEAGLCVAPEDPEALAGAIRLLAHDPALRQQMGANGRRFALSHHSRRTAAEQFERLLRIITE
jgi:colanic acid biosynthesis glycosyl transferase WcaI